ncbi:MAG: SDR family NAD(P)-dependent oxidoreductase [Chloroflexi bacterium]|nr:SDR family NAD(P)-dependent oxidoreductase [Chloroflexota bacterium]
MPEQTEKRVALVTGANGAIGLAIARQLAALPGYELVLVGRNEARLAAATEAVQAATGNRQVRHEIADLSRHADILALAGRWSGPLHVLVNNAAATPRRRQETPESIELQWATNVLGYFWLTQAFREQLSRAAPARVVNVASYYAGDLDLSDVEFVRRPYDNNGAYRQSKQANRMLTAAFAQRLDPQQVVVNACHPGDVSSQLSNDLGFGGQTSPDDGARTPVWLASHPDTAALTGQYCAQEQVVPDPFTQDAAAVEALYQLCLRYSGRN